MALYDHDAMHYNVARVLEDYGIKAMICSLRFAAIRIFSISA